MNADAIACRNCCRFIAVDQLPVTHRKLAFRIPEGSHGTNAALRAQIVGAERLTAP